jgi:hypothetical protein
MWNKEMRQRIPDVHHPLEGWSPPNIPALLPLSRLCDQA